MKTTPKDFWNPMSIKPIASLAQLRELVIQHNEKRMPKWKFRLASDLAVQIQPQVTAKFREFECRAIESQEVDESSFAAGAKRITDQTNFKFDVYSDIPKDWRLLKYTGLIPGQWAFKPAGLGWARDGKPNYDLPSRLVRLFNDGRFDNLNPSTLLSPHCIICGKGLTEPASMARGIGPECWGSGSLSVPWLYKTSQ